MKYGILALSLFSVIFAVGTGTLSRAQDADPVFKSLYVQGDSVNVRAEADVKSPVLKKLHLQEYCDVVERGKEETIGGKRDFWYRIKFFDGSAGKTGWIFGAFTSLKREGRRKLEMSFEGCRADSNNFSHKLFRDQAGKKWDFSDTGHNFGAYEFCAPGVDGGGNPVEVGAKEFIGKKFEVILNDLTMRPSCLWEPAECAKLKAGSRPSIIYLRPVK